MLNLIAATAPNEYPAIKILLYNLQLLKQLALNVVGWVEYRNLKVAATPDIHIYFFLEASSSASFFHSFQKILNNKELCGYSLWNERYFLCIFWPKLPFNHMYSHTMHNYVCCSWLLIVQQYWTILNIEQHIICSCIEYSYKLLSKSYLTFVQECCMFTIYEQLYYLNKWATYYD